MEIGKYRIWWICSMLIIGQNTIEHDIRFLAACEWVILYGPYNKLRVFVHDRLCPVFYGYVLITTLI